MKPKCGNKAKLCYIDAGDFIVYIKPEGIYSDIAKDVETLFDPSNYELDKPMKIK